MDSKAYQEKLIKDVILSIEKNGGNDILSSVILTGSFGRDEPTFAYDAEGKLVLKSDVEIALIYPHSVSKRKIGRLIEDVSSEFEEDLNLMPVSQRRVEKAFNFNFSFFVPKYKTIFTYDLINGSRTIWGEDFLSKIKIDLDKIDAYEAKRLVGNRIGELVFLQTKNINNDYLRKQWRGKVVLAIGSAWLILNKKYQSSYRKQCEVIKNMKDIINKDLGDNFCESYLSVFEFLRNNGEEFEVVDVNLKKYVERIHTMFVNSSLNKPKVNSISRYLKYLVKYTKSKAPFGFKNFENTIIEKLIVDYFSSKQEIEIDADIWHRVLY